MFDATGLNGQELNLGEKGTPWDVLSDLANENGKFEKLDGKINDQCKKAKSEYSDLLDDDAGICDTPPLPCSLEKCRDSEG